MEAMLVKSFDEWTRVVKRVTLMRALIFKEICATEIESHYNLVTRSSSSTS